MSEAKEEHRKDGFQKFWTKDKTEALLSLLEEQASKGQINHELVATELTQRLQANGLNFTYSHLRLFLTVHFCFEIFEHLRSSTPIQNAFTRFNILVLI